MFIRNVRRVCPVRVYKQRMHQIVKTSHVTVEFLVSEMYTPYSYPTGVSNLPFFGSSGWMFPLNGFQIA